MDLNADFERQALLHGAQIEWVDSPIAGVRRRMLDRIGEEVARATSIVSYAPGSRFSPHTHTGGEEFLVLEGVFQDEHGDFPAGSYVRNPPESRHTPGSDSGCVLFVKLWQFDLTDRTHVRTHIDKIASLADPTRPGVQTTPLYRDAREDVRIERWPANEEIFLKTAGGAELFVLEGSFAQGVHLLHQQSWLRIPDGAPLNARVGPEGARVWIKWGHLKFACPPKFTR